jgi:hypothetical protein
LRSRGARSPRGYPWIDCIGGIDSSRLDRASHWAGHSGVAWSADLASRHCGVDRCGHRRADERRLARHHLRSGAYTCRGDSAGRDGGRTGALQAGGSLGTDTLLHLGGTLRRTPGPLAQPLDLACLGEGKQRQQRDPHQGNKASDRTHLGEGARE